MPEAVYMDLLNRAQAVDVAAAFSVEKLKAMINIERSRSGKLAVERGYSDYRGMQMDYHC